MVEAQLLADESPADIARKETPAADAIALFEAWHCHVTDQLGCQGYLMHQAIGPLG